MPPPTSARRSPASASRPTAAPEAAPLGAPEFARRLARLGPFEHRPRLAVALSGGPDSLALALLAEAWTRARGGSVLALTVDHRLRPDSAEEAGIVAGWMADRGIPHRILFWRGGAPGPALQARAREARYQLLADACRGAGILHLLLAHHADDQAETFALRQARGSGVDGLAAMAAVRELPGLRLLRPLLVVPKARLIGTLEQAGQPWLADPSNASPAFTRNRLRASGLPRGALLARASEAATERHALDRILQAWLVRHARIDPAGFVHLNRWAWRAAAQPVQRRALLHALMTVGGRTYPPRQASLARLLAELAAEPAEVAGTLAGCRILAGPDQLLVVREPAACGPPVDLRPGASLSWDGRFRVRAKQNLPAGLVCRALGRDGLAARKRLVPLGAPRSLPAAVLPGLPSIWQHERLLAVPHLKLMTPEGGPLPLDVAFCPRRPLAAAPFAAFEDAFDALLGVDVTLS